MSGFGGLFCFFYAVTKLPLADVTVIHFTNPVFTAILAALFLKETMKGQEVLGLLLSVTGVVLVAQPSFLFGEGVRTLDLFAVMIALLGSLFSAGAYTTIRKLGSTEHYLVVIFYFAIVATPVSVPAMWADALWPTPVEWLLLLGVGVVTQIAQIFLTKGLHRERAGRAMAVSYIQVVFATIMGFTLFSEVPTLLGAGGAVLIFSGLMLVARKA
jgi:drug/metabolite transporter (DMT)-like permease